MIDAVCAIESAPDGFLVADQAGRLLAANAAYCRMSGYGKEELLALSLADLEIRGATGETAAHIDRLLATGHARFETLHRRKDGSIWPLEASVSMPSARDGLFVFIRDLTGQEKPGSSPGHEDNLAQAVFDSMMLRPGLNDHRLRYWLQPAGRFGGDAVAATRTSDGTFYVLLADAIGHGLAAAIAVVPLLTLFYRLAEQAPSVGHIACELNREVLQTSPANHFVAAIVLALAPRQDTVSVWQGGMPDMLHLDPSGYLKQRYPSTSLPLGVARFSTEAARVQTVPMQPCDQLALFSAGLAKSANAEGATVGTGRIEQALVRQWGIDQIQAVREMLESHMRGYPSREDIAIVTLTSGPVAKAARR